MVDTGLVLDAVLEVVAGDGFEPGLVVDVLAGRDVEVTPILL